MKLLIITQKVDRKDPILGFFHRWVGEFGKQCEKLTVVGQLVGEHAFEGSVKVESLGKEKGKSQFQQIMRFWALQWRLRSEYDAVLVHMTPIWIVLGAPLWILLRKRMYLWYEARGTRWPLRISLRLVRKVFSASVHGMPIRTRKSVVVGHGIDTELFVPGTEPREERLLITVGRITASKNLDVILRGFHQLPKGYRLMVVGNPITAADKQLQENLYKYIKDEHIQDRVNIEPATQEVVRSLLQQASAFIHASDTSLDKAVLEAMATQCPVISTAEAVQPLLLPVCHATKSTLGARIQEFCELGVSERFEIAEGLREQVVRDHSLSRLVEKLTQEMIS